MRAVPIPLAWRRCLCACLILVSACAVANANTKPPPPARPAAPARPSAPAGGGFRSGGMATNGGRPYGGSAGVHIPGGAAGGAHIPGGGGGAHMPGGMAGAGGGGGAHLPSNMAPRAPVHSAVPAEGNPHADRASPPAHLRETHAAPARPASPHGEQHNVGARNEPRSPARPGEARQSFRITEHAHAPRQDPRIAGSRLVHTAGIADGHVLRAPPRQYLRPDAHRDIAGDRAFVRTHERDFHTSRVAEFDRRELGRWRGGLWRNEWHYGRRGWWWDVDGVWYGYPEPIFPYPEEVAPLIAYDAPVIEGPDMTVAEIGPDAVYAPGVYAPGVAAGPLVIPPLPATPVGWYRCDQPGGYYPSLNTCGTYWALVQNAPMPGE